MTSLTPAQQAMLPAYRMALDEFLYAAAEVGGEIYHLKGHQLLWLADKAKDLDEALLPFHDWVTCWKCGVKNNLNHPAHKCRCGADLIPF
jgi:hypothetical protein